MADVETEWGGKPRGMSISVVWEAETKMTLDRPPGDTRYFPGLCVPSIGMRRSWCHTLGCPPAPGDGLYQDGWLCSYLYSLTSHLSAPFGRALVAGEDTAGLAALRVSSRRGFAPRGVSAVENERVPSCWTEGSHLLRTDGQFVKTAVGARRRKVQGQKQGFFKALEGGL